MPMKDIEHVERDLWQILFSSIVKPATVRHTSPSPFDFHIGTMLNCECVLFFNFLVSFYRRFLSSLFIYHVFANLIKKSFEMLEFTLIASERLFGMKRREINMVCVREQEAGEIEKKAFSTFIWHRCHCLSNKWIKCKIAFCLHTIQQPSFLLSEWAKGCTMAKWSVLF